MRRPKPKALTRTRRDTLRFFLFISPWLIGFLAFTVIPMGMSLYYSFTEWNVLTPATWVGLDNYVELFQDPLFFQSIKVTCVYTLLTVPIGVVLSLMVAILLNFEGRGVSLLRTLLYAPAILSGVVVALLWQWIFNTRYGLLNGILQTFGVQGPRWLADPDWAMAAMVIMSLWSIGGGIIMYLAGLQAIPRDLYEAATLEGAGFWSKLWHVTLPSMSPIILFLFLTSLIGALQTFTAAYVMTSGGPENSTLFYAYYLYQNGITYRKMGKASAMGWLFFLGTSVLSFLVLKVSRKTVYYESDEGGELA